MVATFREKAALQKSEPDPFLLYYLIPIHHLVVSHNFSNYERILHIDIECRPPANPRLLASYMREANFCQKAAATWAFFTAAAVILMSFQWKLVLCLLTRLKEYGG